MADSTYSEEAETGSRAEKAAAAEAPSASKQLQGTWKSIKSTYEYANYRDGLTIQFEGDKATAVVTPRNKEQSAIEREQVHFAVHESKTPMWIDFGQKKGIFQIEGDLLIVCMGDEKGRPTKSHLVATPTEVPVAGSSAVGYPVYRPPCWVRKELRWDNDELWVFKKAP